MGTCPDNYSFLNYFEENKLYSFLTTFTFAVIFLFIYILNKYTFFDRRRIPRAVRPTAPFGNIKDVLFRDTTLYIYLWKYYNKFKRKGYKYGGLYLFFKPSVLVIDPDLFRKVSLDQTSLVDVTRKPFLPADKVVNLFDDSKLENFLSKYNDTRDTAMSKLTDENMSSVLHDFFMETTSRAFGFETNLEFLTVINSVMNKKIASGFSHYIGLVYPIFQTKIKVSCEMKALIKDIIDSRKKNDVREKDLVQGFVDLFNEHDYKLEDVVLAIFNIFVDNIIYSYTSLLFCLYELASNSSIQQDLIDEIRRYNSENKTMNLKNVQQLSLLDAVVKEALRKYPPTSTIVKKCKANYNIDDDLELPKGSFIFYSIMGVQRDPKNYIQPEKFDPDRFLEENKGFNCSNIYMPFGMDSLKEIGLKFTVLNIKLGLISIFSSYKVSLNNSISMEFDSKKLPVSPKEPLPVIFEPLSI